MAEVLADLTVLPGLKQVSGCWLISYFCEKPDSLHLPTHFLYLHILSLSRSACECKSGQQSRSHVLGSVLGTLWVLSFRPATTPCKEGVPVIPVYE